MGKKKYASVNFDVKLVPQEKINNEFTLCKCYAFGLGKNRNYSHISKENMERCKSTLSYAPVVGHLMEKYDKDGNVIGRYFGGHDYTITEDWELKPLTVPYGVVVADSFQYEMVNEYKDNHEREYLTCDVILWTGRYPELLEAVYDETTYFNESAELNVEEYRPLEDDSNYVDITDFTFSALCILGKSEDAQYHTEPCFIESKIQPKQFSVCTDDFAEAMNEMKEKLSFCLKNQSSTTVTDVTMEVDIDKNNGGSTMAEEIKNEVVDEVTETVVEETLEETVENTVEDVAEEVVEETTDETTEEIVEETVEENKEEASTEEVVEETTEETVVEESNEDYSVLYSELKEKYDALENEVVSLREYKQTKESEERKCAEDALFADYEEAIGETEEFKSLKEKASEFSLDALKKECLCIVGMYSMTNKTKETNKSDSLKFSLEPEVSEDEPYGGLMKKYLGK